MYQRHFVDDDFTMPLLLLLMTTAHRRVKTELKSAVQLVAEQKLPEGKAAVCRLQCHVLECASGIQRLSGQ